MNDEQLEDFRLWFETQPDYISYSQCRSFLSTYLGLNSSETEIEMAKLASKGEISIIKTYKTRNKGKRVFLQPLVSLSEEHIRQVWDASPHVGQNVNDLIKAVHDRTGHELNFIETFVRSLHDEGKAQIEGDQFRWARQ